MSYRDTPDSQHDVVTTAGAVISEFKQMIVEEMPGLSTVFDKDLSYETALKKWLKENPEGENPIPLFAYNRTISNYGDRGLQRRGRRFTGVLKLEQGVAKYSVYQGEFFINFMYVTQSMEEVEKFEVAYYGAEGVGKTTKVTVTMPKLGDFDYFLEYNDLDDIQIEKEGVFYKAIIGTVKVRGMYFTFKGQSGLIKEIRSRIITSNNIPRREEKEVLSDCIIDENDK
ncbi:MAG: hypothetical protein HRU18_01560 [Pseudoalteromonas sp.]|uniref:hypothetical protein n=1 Tax=Pseudoalteromonas sp. TaxID=53249 RepID=UPI001D47348E|nr:hypothetical protein [Pseudoalteromonas sp.]NRA76868.1 hypothetical protein [Pseudoalteromonas sp.]